MQIPSYAPKTILSLFALSLLLACPKAPQKTFVEEEHQVSVQSFSPEGKTGTTPVEIRFSKDVVDESALGKPASGTLVEFEPSIPGHYEWREPSLLAFVPSEPFRPSTRYTATVREDAGGKREMVGETKFEFNTELFHLESVTPFFEGVHPSIQVRVNLELSHPITPRSARELVRFDDANGNPIETSLMSSDTSRVMSFQFQRLLRTEEAQAIKVALDERLGPAAGGEPLGKSVTRVVNPVGRKALKIEEVQPSQYDGQPAIRVRFDHDIDPAAAEKFITVNPKVELRMVSSYRGVTLLGGFEPGKTYAVTIRQGLTSRAGGVVEDPVTRSVAVPDLSPQLRFESLGSYLMRSGRQSFAIQTVNISELEIEVDKVFENNLVHVLPKLSHSGRSSCYGGDCYDEYYYEEYYGGGYSSSDLATMGRRLFQGTVDVSEERNKWVSTGIPFEAIDEDDRRGLYRVRVKDSKNSWIYAEKWMLATDLGLTAKVGRSQASVQVVSLKTLEPIAGAEVSFISRTNQLIGKARTNYDGFAVQNLQNTEPGEPLSLVTARLGSDFSYLTLAGTSIPTADFDVGGAGDTGAPYEAFIYPDRGVYRPGDEAKVTVLLRDESLMTPPAFPYRLEVRDPRWRVFDVRRGTSQVDGAQVFELRFPEDAPTGTYSVRALTPEGRTVLGSLSLKVEDFMPDRIKVEVDAQSTSGEIDEEILFDVESAYLFGAPGSGLKYEAQCQFNEASVKARGLGSFRFGVADSSENLKALRHVEDLGEGELDEEGKTQLGCQLDSSQMPWRPVRATLVTTVSERGGRAVTGGASVVLHAHDHYVGIRRNASTDYAEINQDAGVEVVAVDRDGNPKAGVKVEATIYSVEWKSILKLVNNRYRYVSEQTAKPVTTTQVVTQAGPTKLPFKPSATGQYRIDVSGGAEGSRSSMRFWVSGPGWGAWEMRKPDQLALTLDKKKYAAGETAEIMVRAPFEGTLQVTVERDRVLWSRSIPLDGNTGKISVPVTAAMTPNAYVVAQLIRSPKSVEKQAPMRAFGVVPLLVEADQHRLAVELEAPKQIRPNSPLEVKVKAEGTRGFARMTLAAVDEGILRITGFEGPDPYEFFTRKRRLGVRTHDIFDQLLPEDRSTASAIVKTGGGDAPSRAKHLSPVSVKRVKPVALWSGVVALDAAGEGTVTLDVPQFQGSLRLMAVVFERERFGGASRNVGVRDPIVLTPTLPRFLGPLDEIEVPVEVFNGTGTDGAISVAMQAGGRVQAVGSPQQSVNVKKNGTKLVKFRLRADEVAGKAKIVFTASLGAHRTRATTELPIRPPNTTTTEGVTAVVGWDEPFNYEVPAGYLPGTLEVNVSVASFPAGQFGASLQYLLRYPYGCVEQTTSRAFPLIYLRDLARHAAPELAEDSSVDYYVNAAVGRLSTMLTRDGALSYWPGGSYGYAWSTIYGAHFLVEAKKAGYEVPDSVLDRILAHLNQVASGGRVPFYAHWSESRALKNRAYASYVLALAGRPNRGALYALNDEVFRMSELDDKKKKRPVDEETKTLTAGALLLAGDSARGSAFLEGDVSGVSSGKSSGFWSRTRADALMLSVLADVDPRHRSVPALMKVLTERAKVGRWYNTQENAFALLALGKIGRTMSAAKYWGSIDLDGTSVEKFNSDNPASVTHKGSDWVGKTLQLTVTGKGSAYAGVTVSGIRAGLLEPESKGIEVDRTFLDEEGNEVNPDAIAQGDLVITRIRVSATGATRVDNAAIVDLLPAGLEIENPRLSGAAVYDWMKNRSVPDYVDIRDDRILMFTSYLSRGAPRTYYYTSRAITKGSFVLPHVHVEAMYDPMTHARSGGGRLSVK